MFEGLAQRAAEGRRLMAEDVATFKATPPAPARTADDTGLDANGIGPFSFGETRNRLGALALQHYGLKPDARFSLMRPTSVLPATSPVYFRDIRNNPTQFGIDHYPMGNRKVQLVLLFDAEGKFYRVEFCELGSWGRDEYQTHTADRETFIADLFVKRFGPPTGGTVPAADAVKPGRNQSRFWTLRGPKAGTEVARVVTTQFQVRGYIEKTR